MVASNNPYGHDQWEIVQEIAGQEQEAERRKQQEREAHVRNLKAASRLIDAFDHNASAFKKSGILYCLEKEKPPFAPTICLFRRHRSRNPEMISIPVIVDSPHGIFSLRSLVKRKKREALKWVIHHTKFYEEHHTRLSDDPEEAAIEVVTRLRKRNIEFNSLWGFDRTIGMCARRYFAIRRAALGLGFVTAIALVLDREARLVMNRRILLAEEDLPTRVRCVALRDGSVSRLSLTETQSGPTCPLPGSHFPPSPTTENGAPRW